MKERIRTIWHHIDGPLGGLLVVFFFGLSGYVIRGYEDGGLVASLSESINSARMDERALCVTEAKRTLDSYVAKEQLRAQQVATLIEQNRALYSLVARTTAARSAELQKATSAAEAATRAANNAAVSANKADETGKEVSKKLDTATQPSAIVPKPWSNKLK